MVHFFDVDIAKEYGVNAAVLLTNLNYWIEHNEKNGLNFYDGTYWTYNSRKAFAELFPYMSARQIDTAMKHLIDAGIVKTGNYNKVAYDRTLWYAITKKGKCILSKCKMEDAEMLNGNHQNVTPIPDNKPDRKPDRKPNNKCGGQSSVDDIVFYLNKKAGTAYRANSAKTKQLIDARMKEGFTIDDFKAVIDKKCREWKCTDMAKYIRPETLFGTKFESYLNQQDKRSAFSAADDLDGIL